MLNAREYSLLPYLETLVEDINFKQNVRRAITMRWEKDQSSAFQG